MAFIDPNTFANLDEVQTTHLHLDLFINFNRQILEGSARLTLKALKDTSVIVLDTRYIVVKKVTIDGIECKWSLAEHDEKFGSALSISPHSTVNKGNTVELTIEYETSDRCTASQWLEAEQTVGKRFPYLFTQCEIHARSLVPCQDSPSVKISYTAKLRSPLQTLMAATLTGEEKHDDGTTTYSFEQKTLIPSYLIAIASGDIVGKKVGPRSTVWGEAEIIEAAAWEFEDTDKFLRTGEEFCTPYEWGNYDLLVLPASFPYGGMEGCLTFVTPTLLAGDRSSVDVIAHEISHSWMGNLVTAKSWEHFWLNEGWTVFLERKIMGRMHGHLAAEFSAIIGWKALKESIELFGHESPGTLLNTDLNGIDPDDYFSTVPYEKGFNLLYYLQKIVGGPEIFEPYMKAHVQNFANKSITTQNWKDFLYEYMEKHHGTEVVAALDGVDWEAWLHKPGMPPVDPQFDTTLANECFELASRWDKARHQDQLDFAPSDVEKFSALQKVVFLERLSDLPPLPHDKLAKMDDIYKFTPVRNSEIRFRWQQVCLQSEYETVFPHVVQFLTEQGRMKYVRPLYRLLNKCKNGSELAKETFLKHKSFYHPICAALIEKDIGL